MKFLNYLVVTLTIIMLNSCGESKEYELVCTPKTTLRGKGVLELKLSSDTKIDSVSFYIGKKQFKHFNNMVHFNATEIGVGHHEATALVFTTNKVHKVVNFVNVYADKPYKRLSYKLVNTYPHDKKSFTQGLEFYNGFLYETTGRVGSSWLRKLDYKTGEVLQQINLKNYFGEGMTIVNNSLFWLTWQGGIAKIFNPETFTQKGMFKYDQNSIEGWGLTHNEKNQLIKSDGSHKLFYLNEKGQELKEIQVASNDKFVDRINEIEYVNGKIYANRWITTQPIKSIIMLIDAKTGVVEGVLDLSNLRNEIMKDQDLTNDQVLNGIAYNPETKTFFVTGKLWGKLFEIEILE